MRRVVANTGPILHLYEAGALDLLPLSGEVQIPPAVDAELAYLVPNWQRPNWLDVNTLAETTSRQANAWQQAGLLDHGEAESLALAQEQQADWFLTDDAAARLLAQSLGLEVHGSLGIILWAAAGGYWDRPGTEVVLNRLFHSSLWISPRVRAEAKAALDQLYES